MNLLSEDLIQFRTSPAMWEEALRISSELLLNKNYIKETYIEKMINNVNEFGTYIVIAPGIAMPHSRAQDGALKQGFSVTVFDKDIYVIDKKVRVFLTLACNEDDQHIEMLQKIAKLLNSQEKIDLLINSTSKKEVMDLFKGEKNE